MTKSNIFASTEPLQDSSCQTGDPKCHLAGVYFEDYVWFTGNVKSFFSNNAMVKILKFCLFTRIDPENFALTYITFIWGV